MLRPCYLVVDQEHSGSISTRKLVIETAKFNVITAYSSSEAIETLEKFPAVDGAIIDAVMKDMPCQQLIDGLRALKPSIKIILVGAPGHERCERYDHYLESFLPTPLLALLQSIHPRETEAVEKRDEELKQHGF